MSIAKILNNNAASLAAIKVLMKHSGITTDVLLASIFVDQIALETGHTIDDLNSSTRVKRIKNVVNATDVEYFEDWADKLSEDVAMLIFVGEE